MKTCVIGTVLSFAENYNSIHQSFNIVRNYDRIYLLNPYKTSKYKESIEKSANIKIFDTIDIESDFSSILSGSFTTWQDFYDKFDISIDVNIDDVYLFWPPLSSSSDLDRFKNGLEKNLQTNKYMKMVSLSKNYMIPYMLAKIANKFGSNYIEIYRDPLENSILQTSLKPKSSQSYFSYDIPEYNLKYSNFYQIGMLQRKKSSLQNFLFEESKMYDVCFGYTYITKDRKNVNDFLETKILNNLKNSIIFKKTKTEDNLVDKETYLEYISKSKFTFIVPAYDIKTFSVFRFLESIYFDCLPLVFDFCSYLEFIKTYNIDENIFNKILINETNIGEKLDMNENERKNLLSYFMKKCYGDVL